MNKLKEMIHYIVSCVDNPEHLGELRLYKILWITDLFYYRMHNKSLSGLDYIKLDRGPVPRSNQFDPVREELKKENIIYVDSSRSKSMAILYGIVDKNKLSDQDASEALGQDGAELIREITEITLRKTTDEISELTHDALFDSIEYQKSIPLELAAFSSAPPLPPPPSNW